MTSGLLEYAKNEFELDKPNERGVLLRDTLEKDSVNRKRRHPRLLMQLPLGTDHLWQWFNDMVYGLDKLTSLDILAWQETSGVRLTPWEVGLMKQLDIARRTAR